MATKTWDELYGENAGKETPVIEPIDIEDPVALRKLAKSALVEIVQTAPRNIALVGAIRELLDRVDGKAPQSISMTVKTSAVSMMSAEEILAWRNEAAMLLNEPVMIIPPMPSKITDI